MRVYLNGEFCGKTTFNMSYLRNELLELVTEKEPLYYEELYLGYIKNAIVRPDKIQIITHLYFKIEFYE